MTKSLRTCEQCGQEFFAENGKINAGLARFCSRECYHLSTRNAVERPCLNCGEILLVRPSEATRGVRKYCSVKCIHEHKARIYYTTCICEICGRQFDILKSWIRKGGGRFCSNECKHVSLLKGRIKRICKQCGNEFEIYPYEPGAGRGKFCSKRCLYDWLSIYKRGENSPQWLGGISFEPYGLDWTKELKESIKERDGWHCAMCKLDGNVVHHIDYDKENNSPDNLITLCAPCHGQTNFNREYWREAITELAARNGGISDLFGTPTRG